MKWQQAAAILTVILAGAGVITYSDLFGVLFNLTGMEYNYTGDITCGETCVSYINVTTSYWRVCFAGYNDTKYENETLFKKVSRSRTLHVNLDKVENVVTTEPRVPVDWLVPARGAGNWRPIQDGDCWERGKINKIKLVGHKDMEQTVKWSFLLDEYVDIDPGWFGTTVEYTPTTKTVCSNGICNLVIYSGTTFVEEDETWKHVSEAKSLKNSKIKPVVDFDGVHQVEIINYNYSSVLVKLNISGMTMADLNKYSIKYYDRNNNFKREIKDSVLDFDREGDEIIVELNMSIDEVLHFGENSTTVIYQDADTENLDDAYVDYSAPTIPGSDSDEMFAYATTSQSNYKSPIIKFNISDIPSDKVIHDSHLFMYMENTGLDSGESLSMDAHHVYSNFSWSESTISYNGLPGSTYYNSVYDESITFSFGNPSVGWVDWNVTNATSEEYADSGDNITIWLQVVHISGSPTAIDDLDFWAKEYTGNTALRPYLNVTYGVSLIDNTPPVWSDNSTNNTTAGSSVLFSIFWEDPEDTVSGISELTDGSAKFYLYNGSNASAIDLSDDLESGEVGGVGESGGGSGGTTDVDFEDFEGYTEGTQPSPIGNWNQATFDTDDWYVYTGDGESSSTGPTANYDGYYGMVETSSGGCNSPDTAVLYLSEVIDFDNYSANISFAYNMYGSTMGTLHVKTNHSGSWVSVWSETGDQGTSWYTHNQNISGSGNGQIAMWMDCGASYTSDAAIDSLNVTKTSVGTPDEDANKTAVEYVDIDVIAHSDVNNITTTVYISAYDTSGSVANGNTNATVYLEMYNGTHWVDEGTFTITGTGNVSKTVTTNSILSGWAEDGNKSIRLTPGFIDENDAVNWTGVWVEVDSEGEFVLVETQTFTKYSSSSTCFQEQANESTVCGGLATGSYDETGDFIGCTYWNDGEVTGNECGGGFTTDSLAIINYTIPSTATNESIWEECMISEGCMNYTMAGCEFDDILQIRVVSDIGSKEQECWSGSAWIQMTGEDGVDDDGGIDEERMYWSLGVESDSYVNDSAYWSNFTATISSNTGDTIKWYVIGTDTAGNSNTSDTFEFTTTGTSSCTCPSSGTDWEIDLSDYCVITSNCNIGVGNITFTNTGNITFNADITACTIGGLPANTQGYLGDDVKVRYYC
ncbi:DNRLRE domain-containing protein [Oceanihabitans sediminis]|uniref:DNRLRE domain-containing protein n=1 Tax=Oceanihabitans sediminis TaxID=1812012 RepID=UPI00299DBFB7|nr:DNRLRE domain-containing protein [Oceanihabitans sediminis]MDX1278556.1 DNRLRE domain-containing protein [Oceanihabitans sediminis]